MNIFAYARLIHKKVNSAHRKAKNPFIDSDLSCNPFIQPMYSTLVWIEPDDDVPNKFKK